MRVSRRRFVAAAGGACLAGCNSAEEPERTETVTPVDVPRSDSEVLEAVDSVPVPSIPPAPTVSTAHRRSVVTHVADRIETAETALAEADDVALADVERLDDLEGSFDAYRSNLAAYEADPDRRRFRRLARTVDDVARIIGHVRSATGDLDADGIRTAFGAARDAAVELTDGLEYRLAPPVVDRYPTASAWRRRTPPATSRRASIPRRRPARSPSPRSPATTSTRWSRWRCRDARTDGPSRLGSRPPSRVPARDDRSCSPPRTRPTPNGHAGWNSSRRRFGSGDTWRRSTPPPRRRSHCSIRTQAFPPRN
ncbi:hypothetical protein BRD11_05590 [Halobacteriales archaeon SW_12_69_24]|nr:MAG: hypothetical protein BRD11_05590 [Halobacteriales archaeon SW_12_69_24]